MGEKQMDLDQLLSWVRVGTQEQAAGAEREIGARLKKLERSRTKIFNDNVNMGVLLENLYDFMDDLVFDSSKSDDPNNWHSLWISWKKEYRSYMFKKRQNQRNQSHSIDTSPN